MKSGENFALSESEPARNGLTPSIPPEPPVRRGRGRVGAFGTALAVAAAAYTATCGVVALTLSRPRRVPFDTTPDRLGLEFEPVRFPSRVDRIPLEGWLLPPVPGIPRRRPIVMVHGMGGDRQHEAGGRALDIASSLVGAGHPVLMFDLRGSGRSGGRHFTLGALEVRDVGGAIDFLAARGLAPRGVNLLGYSMGAATATLLGAVDPAVRAVAADSGFAELDGLLENHLPRMSRLPRFFTPGVILAARSLLGVDLHSVRPIDAVPVLLARGVPLMVIHGEADTMVPVSHGRRLAAAYGAAVETHFVAGAEHVMGYGADPDSYVARLTAFFDCAE